MTNKKLKIHKFEPDATQVNTSKTVDSDGYSFVHHTGSGDFTIGGAVAVLKADGNEISGSGSIFTVQETGLYTIKGQNVGVFASLLIAVDGINFQALDFPSGDIRRVPLRKGCVVKTGGSVTATMTGKKSSQIPTFFIIPASVSVSSNKFLNYDFTEYE